MKVDTLKFAIRESKHDLLYKTLRPLATGLIKKQVQKAVSCVSLHFDCLSYLDTIHRWLTVFALVWNGSERSLSPLGTGCKKLEPVLEKTKKMLLDGKPCRRYAL